jgi:DNA-binding MarR family transcriptional regulator
MSARTHTSQRAPRELAVVLHDLAWLLPRTIGSHGARQDPLPTSELEVMRLLARRPGLSVNDVARELGMQSSNVSTAVRSLVEKGTLRRRHDAADGRVVRLEPTEAALASRDRREESWGEAMEDVLAELRDADRAQLLAVVPLLRSLADRLSSAS